MMRLPNVARPTRETLLRVGAAAWAVLITIVTLINLAAVSDRTEPPVAGASDARLSVLETQLADLRQQAEQAAQFPARFEGRIDSLQDAMEERIGPLEQGFHGHAAMDDLNTLSEQVEALETRLRQEIQAVRPPARPRNTTSATPEPPALPFSVIGLELRGGEQFISITPAGASSISSRVLRPGEVEAGWRLDVIEGRTAVLRNGAHVRRVDVP